MEFDSERECSICGNRHSLVCVLLTHRGKESIQGLSFEDVMEKDNLQMLNGKSKRRRDKLVEAQLDARMSKVCTPAKVDHGPELYMQL